jgi:hypothetical protein
MHLVVMKIRFIISISTVTHNNALAFTFVGANLDTIVAQPGNYTYRFRSELYHRMGSLLP